MPTDNLVTRRFFVTSIAATTASLGTPSVGGTNAIGCSALMTAPDDVLPIFRSVKWNMIQTNMSVVEKFKLCSELGYDGMELISPTEISATEIREASEKTSLPVHGVVGMKHWDVRLSSPDPKIREAGQRFLAGAIRDASAFGGDSVLLVPGKVNGADENHDHVWNRSIEEIRKTLPTASRYGVRILIENVWNGFCKTPDQLRDYIDEIDSPWVGCYFDIGNAQKFSPSENWIETLGSRIVKIDIKDWGKEPGFCKIGDGDVNWKAVKAALGKLRFSGWSTAEVQGGGRERLADIASRIRTVL